MNAQEMWVSFYTILRKDIVRLFRIWTQTLLPPAITTGLYFLIFGKFIGSQIQPIHGYTYIQFIVPGLVMMSIITNAFMNTAFNFFQAKFMKHLEEILVSPTPYLVLILGIISGGIVRAFITGAIIIALAMFFTHIPIFSLPIILVFFFLTSTLFSLAGLINGVFGTSFDSVSIFPTFVLTPLTYLGGVFYSVAALPHFWQVVTRFNPILYMINGFRYGFLGISDTSVLLSFAILLGLNIVLMVTTWWLFKTGRGLRP
jgi:ABC-2 type transport system permease protein